jgi:macrolide-specific efflux system membrane fusion protein
MKIYFVIILIFYGCHKSQLYPQQGDIVEAVYGLGVIQSENTYHAKVAVVSSVETFFVTEGQDVKKGQKLFQTDQGSVYVAPFEGKVTNILVTVKENLFPQSAILTLIDVQNIYLEVSLEQQAAIKLRKGMKAEVSFEFFRHKKFQGSIQSIYPKNEQFVAKIYLQHWPSGVLPGMSADVAFEVGRKQSAILVPTNVLKKGTLQVLRAKSTLTLKVETGLTDLEKTEILSPPLLLTDEILIP